MLLHALFTTQVFLFRFNMAASGARIPRILNQKIMLTSYLMAVSSNLIKKIFDTVHCQEFYCYSSRLVL